MRPVTRRLLTGGIAAVTAGTVALLGTPALAAPPAAAPDPSATEPVIVVLADQLDATPATDPS